MHIYICIDILYIRSTTPPQHHRRESGDSTTPPPHHRGGWGTVIGVTLDLGGGVGGWNAGPYIDSLGYICGGPVGVIIGYNHGNNPGKLGRAQVWGVLMGI